MRGAHRSGMGRRMPDWCSQRAHHRTTAAAPKPHLHDISGTHGISGTVQPSDIERRRHREHLEQQRRRMHLERLQSSEHLEQHRSG